VWATEFYDRSATIGLAAMAQATERIELGTAIAYAFGRTPLVLAAEVRDLDELSGGRLTIGLGTGTRRMQQEWHGLDGEHPASRMEELVPLVRCLWRLHEGPVEHEGRFYRVRVRPTAPVVPPLRPQVPIYMAGVNPRMVEAAGAVGDGLVGHPLFTAEYVREVVRPALARGAERAGREEPVPIAGYLTCSVDADREAARRGAAAVIAFNSTVKSYAVVHRLHGFEPQVEAIRTAGVQELRIRSVLTCETPSGVCAVCYGRDLARGTPVNLGEAVGVIAAQSIGEPGTQLTMRTFHIGGAAQISEQSFIESNFEGKIKIKNKGLLKNSDGQTVAMQRNMVVAVLDPDGSERAVHRIQYGARLLVEDGQAIKRGQRIAEWDPYTRPILTEVEGVVAFEDLVEGQSMSETLDESTGIAKRVVIDWRTHRGADLRPAILIKDKHNKVLRLPRGGEARYQLAVDAIISVDPGAHVKAGDVIARIPTESAKTRDITGGLPRVAELFEARRPKEAAIIAETAGTIRFGRDYKNKRRIIIEPSTDGEEPREYLIPKGKHVHLQDGDIIEKGDPIVEGNPAPHDILAIKGVEELAAYLVNEIQDVYRLQGVAINDKHIEVIVRQMLQKVEIDEPGETDLIQGEQIDRIELDEVNARAKAEGRKEATAHPVLLGITKASLQTRSFISAASFQETTRVLTEAAVNGKVDTLEGLKENVIVGRLIPAGTGAMMNLVREVAGKRDALILSEREKEAAAKAAEAEAAERAQLPAAE
jgi:DNA-directed RNA polymerase subunit beta'